MIDLNYEYMSCVYVYTYLFGCMLRPVGGRDLSDSIVRWCIFKTFYFYTTPCGYNFLPRTNVNDRDNRVEYRPNPSVLKAIQPTESLVWSKEYCFCVCSRRHYRYPLKCLICINCIWITKLVKKDNYLSLKSWKDIFVVEPFLNVRSPFAIIVQMKEKVAQVR